MYDKARKNTDYYENLNTPAKTRARRWKARKTLAGYYSHSMLRGKCKGKVVNAVLKKIKWR